MNGFESDGTDVAVGATSVAVGGIDVAVGGTDVFVGVGVGPAAQTKVTVLRSRDIRTVRYVGQVTTILAPGLIGIVSAVEGCAKVTCTPLNKQSATMVERIHLSFIAFISFLLRFVCWLPAGWQHF